MPDRNARTPYKYGRKPDEIATLSSCSSCTWRGTICISRPIPKKAMVTHMSLFKRSIAEMFGTFWLVFGGCGAAILAAAFPTLGIGFAGVSLAFGLTVLTMAFAIGHVSGCHLNPAVSVGLVVAKRFPAKELPAYVIAQVVGAIFASGALYADRQWQARLRAGRLRLQRLRRRTRPTATRSPRASSPRSSAPPSSCSSSSARPTSARPRALRPSPSASALTLIHLISIPVTNTSVNPARSHRSGGVRPRLGALAALALLGRADLRRDRRRRHLQPLLRRTAGAHPRSHGEGLGRIDIKHRTTQWIKGALKARANLAWGEAPGYPARTPAG